MKRKTILEISLHFVFWALTFYYFTNNSVLRFMSMDIKEEYAALLLIIFVIYFNYFWLIPRFFRIQKIFKYFLFLFFSLLMIATLEFLMLKDDIYKSTSLTGNEFQNSALYWNYFGILFRDTLFVAFFTMFKIYRDAIQSYKFLEEKTNLERINFINQIEMVKSKINTHFFFNTLHSIQVMAQNKSDKTAEVLHKLTLLMKYVVVESEEIMTSLDKEIIFLQRYIELEKIRKPTLNLKFKIEGETEHFLLPPMIFESFVNNAFKYNDYLGNGSIEIKIICQGKDILFLCRNALDKTIKANVNSTGKGLRNTINRLKLHYPEHYVLDIQDTDNYYKVSLLLKARF